MNFIDSDSAQKAPMTFLSLETWGTQISTSTRLFAGVSWLPLQLLSTGHPSTEQLPIYGRALCDKKADAFQPSSFLQGRCMHHSTLILLLQDGSWLTVKKKGPSQPWKHVEDEGGTA